MAETQAPVVADKERNSEGFGVLLAAFFEAAVGVVVAFAHLEPGQAAALQTAAHAFAGLAAMYLAGRTIKKAMGR